MIHDDRTWSIGCSHACLRVHKYKTITSLYSSTRFIGVACGPLVASILLKHIEWLFYIFAAIAFVCCFIALFFIKPGTEKAKVQ